RHQRAAAGDRVDRPREKRAAERYELMRSAVHSGSWTVTVVESRCVFSSQRRRIGFSTAIASTAVVMYMLMMTTKTGIHDPVDSWSSAATGPPSTDPTPCAIYRQP